MDRTSANPDSNGKRKVNRVIVFVMNAHKIMKPRKYTGLGEGKRKKKKKERKEKKGKKYIYISRVIRATAP